MNLIFLQTPGPEKGAAPLWPGCSMRLVLIWGTPIPFAGQTSGIQMDILSSQTYIRSIGLLLNSFLRKDLFGHINPIWVCI